jgi:lysozyme
MTETIEQMLFRHERFIPHAYRDSEGYWTIGIGRLIDQRKGGGISKEEATYLLKNDIEKCRQQLDGFLPWWKELSEERQMVLLDMCFNLGMRGLLGFKKTLGLMQEGNYKEAAEAMLKSKWASQVGNRAIELSKMMEGENET